ncbi:DNA repair ATPase [Streptomyces sp. NPDC059166]|uniref:DNA repair ATPase n=1 Tax=Streptomyces sp. NPDC059166 TaxID=3346752 RepID=UPI0036970290
MDSDLNPTEPDAGAYEVLGRRLREQAGELVRRAEALNARRTEEFGSAGLRLLDTGQVATEAASVARDVVAVGGHLLFGFERGPGARGEADVGDVLLLRGSGPGYPAPPTDRPDAPGGPDGAGLLEDAAFVREFAALHRYYRDARLLRLRRVDGRLLAVFRTGETAEDIRVLRWALGPDGSPGAFLDARGDRDHVFPPSHDFDWIPVARDAHVPGRHPCVAVLDTVFVDTLGGTLTIRTAPDTESPDGIYEEPVDEPLQSLADASVEYASAGPLILLRVRPYKEDAWRHLVFNTLLSDVRRLDGIGTSCHRLPEDQGIIFSGGYHLTTGTTRTFDTVQQLDDPVFEGAVRSPNGEDVLYVFRSRDGGRSLLLPYNVIRQEVATPLTARGHALLDDGTLILLKGGEDGPGRVHTVQRWETPYVSDTHAAARPAGTGPLARTGNADLVRGISDCLALAHGVRDMAPTAAVYRRLAADCARAGDRYHWLSDPELGALAEPLDELRATAHRIVDEFDTVQELTGQATAALDEAAAELTALVRRIRGEAPRSATAWVESLTGLRRAHGRLATLAEMRYADTARVSALSEEASRDLEAAARRAVTFLSGPDAFAPYHEDLARLTEEATGLKTVADAEAATGRLTEITDGLGAVTEVVASLDIGDTTVRTAVVERIAEVLGGANRTRAVLDARRGELVSREGHAEFAAESALLGQAVTGALGSVDSPEACDEQLAGVLLRLENLESRFGGSDDFLARIAERRTEVYEAFSGRKQILQDTRARRAERLAQSAARVLETVSRRLAALDDLDAVHTYFASDPMVAKVRRTSEELRALGDPVRAEELDGRLKAARQEAGRALRDRGELYSDGGAVIRLGRHRFAVNDKPFDLTLVPSGDGVAFALTGTDYRAPVTDPEFEGARAHWGRSLPSESPEVYRAEHLAARLLAEHGADALARADLPSLVREAAAAAYDEGYQRGVHDEDALAVLTVLLRLHAEAGLLRYPSSVRAAAQFFWAHRTDEALRASWTLQARSLARARDTFGLAPAVTTLQREWASAMACEAAAAEYLFEELAGGPAGFVTSAGARSLLAAFRRTPGAAAYDEDLAALAGDLPARRRLVEAWLSAYTAAHGRETDGGDLAEAVAVELCPGLERYGSDAPQSATVEGLLGDHPRVVQGRLTIRLDELLTRTAEFRANGVPGFRAYQRLRTRLVDAERSRLRLDDHRPRTMPAFVRSKLLDEVYLPLIGDSLAKQLGTADADRRTDSQGLLLLVSPPGYGKTTLMEYVAERLGMVLVKVSGPNLGHEVTSLDPALAPGATARQEVEKINFAFESGSNTLLHLDDIQHTSPELLQKFIPLCDATRRVEGVRDGRPRSYDLRGKRFAVVMTGNPYTESGARFRIPDMLANRADVRNLGEVLSGRDEVFALSFVENALTANPVLAPLAGSSRGDLDVLVRMAAGTSPARTDRLEHGYAPAELERIVSVLRHLLTARDTVLAVNAAYIASAAQSEETRTEPPFRLQGSYRDMNKIAERIVPAMNDAEVAAVITDHYTAEAQTLTTGAESNLLKLAALRGTLTPAQAERRAAILSGHARSQALGGPDGDPATRAVGALGLLADRIAAVESAIERAADPRRLLASPPPCPHATAREA